MKTVIYHIIILLLLATGNIGLQAQETLLTNKPVNFSFTEKQHSKSDHKLPQAITTNNYDLKYHRFNWVIDPAQRYISGSVTSYFVATQDRMNSIQFQLNASLTADSALFEGKKYSIDRTGDIITIPFNSEVLMGKLDSVTVYYHGIPASNGFGSFENYVHNGAPSMWTLSEPYGASDWWPSKNDLTDKIDSIDVYVVMPKGNHAASNGILVSETPYGTNSTLDHWKHRYPIASYLIAIAVTNYAIYSDYYKTGTDSIQILNYVYPEDSVEIRPLTSDVVKSMGLYENLFTPYPVRKEKYGHAQCNIGGGMEHQTMTFLGKTSFNHYILSHELAHSWFGDMVTCGSWQDIWLNEGFASYCYLLSLENLYTDNSFRDNINSFRGYVNSNQQGSVFCTDTTNVSRIFSSPLSYFKGALLVRMLRWIVGDRDFYQGLKNYLNDPSLKYGFARTDELKRHLETQSGKNLTDFFTEWFYGTGVPDYQIQVNQQSDLNTSVIINQTPYNSDVNFFSMILPIKFKGENKDTTIVFNHSYSGQAFNITTGFRIDSVFFDPDHQILWNQSTVTFQQTTSGLGEINVGPDLVITPVPAIRYLEVHHKPGEIDYFQIFNLDGVPEITIPSKQGNTLLEIDIRNLKPGMYILKAGNSAGLESKKFIVSKE